MIIELSILIKIFIIIKQITIGLHIKYNFLYIKYKILKLF